MNLEMFWPAILLMRSSGIIGEINSLLLILDTGKGDLYIWTLPLSERGELLSLLSFGFSPKWMSSCCLCSCFASLLFTGSFKRSCDTLFIINIGKHDFGCSPSMRYWTCHRPWGLYRKLDHRLQPAQISIFLQVLFRHLPMRPLGFRGHWDKIIGFISPGLQNHRFEIFKICLVKLLIPE